MKRRKRSCRNDDLVKHDSSERSNKREATTRVTTVPKRTLEACSAKQCVFETKIEHREWHGG